MVACVTHVSSQALARKRPRTRVNCTHLEQLCRQGILVKVGFGQQLDGVFTAIPGGGMTEIPVVELHRSCDSSAMFVVRRRRGRAGENFAYKIHNSVATSAKRADDLEFICRLIIDARLRRTNGHAHDRLALKDETLTDHISLG